MSRPRLILTLVLGAIALAVLIGLGTWQVERIAWKEGIIERIESRIGSPPREIDAVQALWERTGDVDYLPVRLTGRFLHEGERYFLSTFKGQAGWNIYTPMLLGGGERIVFVNRGFVPYEMRDPAARPQGQLAGAVTLMGLARNGQSEKPASMVPDNDPERNVFYWRNLEELSQGLAFPPGAQLLPFIVDAGPEPVPGGYPAGGATVVDIPNNHLEYALTWYGLAAVLAAMLAGLVWNHWRSSRA